MVVASIFAVLSILACIVATLLMLVLLLASAPNSSEAAYSLLKRSMWSVFIAGSLGVICGVWALIVDKPWTSAACGAAPLLFDIALLIYLTKALAP